MRKFISILSLVLVVLSCNKTTVPGLEGTVEDSSLNGKEIYLIRHNNVDIVSSDTAVITDNRFVFSDIAEGIYYLLMDDSAAEGEIEEGLPIYINQGKATVHIQGKTVIIGGNPENDAFREMMDKDRPLVNKMIEIESQFAEESKTEAMTNEHFEELNNQMSQLMLQENEIINEYVYQNITNPLGEEVFLNYIQNFSQEDIEKLLSLAGESLRSNPLIVETIARIDVMKKVGIGTEFTDFSLPNAQGKTVSLSDYAGKGNYVLLDFWASWCAPCLQEIPAIADIYKQYKNKNFEIIGLSLDDDQKAWLNCIKKLKMEWPQLSDAEGDNAASYIYHVSAIPHTILIDPKGIIIAKDLRGKELKEKLEEVLQ
jgi:peroxiredoxin